MKEALAAKQQMAASAPGNSVQLTAGALAVYWEEFIDRFRQANKMTIVGNLQLAQVVLLGPEEIGLISRNIVQFRFMEEEKLEIADSLRRNSGIKTWCSPFRSTKASRKSKIPARPRSRAGNSSPA